MRQPHQTLTITHGSFSHGLESGDPPSVNYDRARYRHQKDWQIELAPLKGDLLLLKWMVGLLLGGVLALILRSFFLG